MLLSVSFLDRKGLSWLAGGGKWGGAAPVDQLLCLLECVNKCGSERADRCLPRPAHHMFSFKLFGFSDTERVKYRIARLLHLIW